MQKSTSSTRRTDLAFLIAGLMDSIVGALLLLTWLDLLPFDLATLGIPRWLAGVFGVGLSVSGVVVVTYIVTRLREPE